MRARPEIHLDTEQRHIGYETVQLQTTLLSSLPSQIASLNETIAGLRGTLQESNPSSTEPSNLALPLDATLSLVSERRSELDSLNQQIETLQQDLGPMEDQLEEARRELEDLEGQKNAAVQRAREAMKRRGEGSNGFDELEMKGRWLSGVDSSLRNILGIDAAA